MHYHDWAIFSGLTYRRPQENYERLMIPRQEAGMLLDVRDSIVIQNNGETLF